MANPRVYDGIRDIHLGQRYIEVLHNVLTMCIPGVVR